MNNIIIIITETATTSSIYLPFVIALLHFLLHPTIHIHAYTAVTLNHTFFFSLIIHFHNHKKKKEEEESLMKCIICEKDNSKYRCRLCTAAYCSAACFKRHRGDGADAPTASTATAAPLATSGREEFTTRTCAHQQALHAAATAAQQQRQREAEEQDPFSDASYELLRRRRLLRRVEQAAERPAAAPPAIEEENTEDVLYMLSDDHLAALAHDGDVRRQLRAHELQGTCRRICRCRSKLEALETAMHNNADFRQFCEAVLHVVAAVPRRRRPRE
ncbi:zinc finger family protein [Strigomonas culicis]|uniref:Zinc finger family protein n=1 Tax=Strigomonas culicis TaxID=28005 RepID=S9TK58_9TRYP|nr:zinc finger family protein [Strigomonas culicis]|eukprot:EPY16733.1 zinc finger family protein [Strigomonas culicis]